MSSPVLPHLPQQSELSPAQARFVYWLNGLAPVVTNVITPLVVFWKMGGSSKLPLVKYNQQVNEVVRQFISGTIGLVSYFGGGELTKGVLNRVFDNNGRTLDESSKQVAMIVGGVAMSFIGFAFVRPYVSTELICKFLKQEKGLEQSISDKKAQEILKAACPNPQSLEKGMNLLEGTLKEQAAELAGAKSSNAAIRWLQNKVDQHLVPGGQPNLKKTALVSTVALSGYLALLTGTLWGVNRALSQKTKPEAPDAAIAQRVITMPYPIPQPLMGALPSASASTSAAPHFSQGRVSNGATPVGFFPTQATALAYRPARSSWSTIGP